VKFRREYPTTQNGRMDLVHWLCWGLGFTSRCFLCICYILCI